jgi:hypothetical protein
MITARNTTTPDSALIQITVTEASTGAVAIAAAEALMATSRHLKGATVLDAEEYRPATWLVTAEWVDAPPTACTCTYNTHRPHGQHTRTDVHRDPRCPVTHER